MPEPSNSPKVSREFNAMQIAADHDRQKGEHDQQRGDQTQFLADDGKNKIGVMLGNKAEFLPAIAQAKAGPTARAEREHRLIRLVADVGLMFLEIKPAKDALRAHRIVHEGTGQSATSAATPAARCNVQRTPATISIVPLTAAHQDGRAAVRFDKNQAEDERDDKSRE